MASVHPLRSTPSALPCWTRSSQALAHHPWSITINSFTPYQQGQSMLQLQVSVKSAVKFQAMTLPPFSLRGKYSCGRSPLEGAIYLERIAPPAFGAVAGARPGPECSSWAETYEKGACRGPNSTSACEIRLGLERVRTRSSTASAILVGIPRFARRGADGQGTLSSARRGG